MRLDLECAGSAAVLEKLSLFCSLLGQARDRRRKAIEDLQVKLRTIQEFAKVAVSQWLLAAQVTVVVDKQKIIVPVMCMYIRIILFGSLL